VVDVVSAGGGRRGESDEQTGVGRCCGRRTPLTQRQVRQALDAVLDAIAEALTEGEALPCPTLAASWFSHIPAETVAF